MGTEAPETTNFNPLALAQRTNHAVEDYLEQILGLLMRNRNGLSNL